MGCEACEDPVVYYKQRRTLKKNRNVERKLVDFLELVHCLGILKGHSEVIVILYWYRNIIQMFGAKNIIQLLS